MADPRRRRGVRHRLVVILGLAVCAVLAGARSFTAIAE
jgi:DDE_Tnp_1-associated